MEACSLLVNLRKGMQSSSEQPFVGEEHFCVTTLITAAKETTIDWAQLMTKIFIVSCAIAPLCENVEC